MEPRGAHRGGDQDGRDDSVLGQFSVLQNSDMPGHLGSCMPRRWNVSLFSPAASKPFSRLPSTSFKIGRPWPDGRRWSHSDVNDQPCAGNDPGSGCDVGGVVGVAHE